MSKVKESIDGFLRFHLITIGIKNNLFEHLKSEINIKELAVRTKCDERYLLEWCQGKIAR
jgi:hypothetical protein